MCVLFYDPVIAFDCNKIFAESCLHRIPNFKIIIFFFFKIQDIKWSYVFNISVVKLLLTLNSIYPFLIREKYKIWFNDFPLIHKKHGSVSFQIIRFYKKR